MAFKLFMLLLAACALQGCLSFTDYHPPVRDGFATGERLRTFAIGGKGSVTTETGLDIRYDNEESFKELAKTGRAGLGWNAVKKVSGDVSSLLKSRDATAAATEQAKVAADSDLNLLREQNSAAEAAAELASETAN